MNQSATRRWVLSAGVEFCVFVRHWSACAEARETGGGSGSLETT